MGVIRGTLRAGVERGTEAVEGILREGCGREAMPVPGGTACPHSAGAGALPWGVLTFRGDKRARQSYTDPAQTPL